MSFLIVAMAFVAQPAAHAQRAAELVGEWKSETYVAGETGLMSLSFFRDGTYSRKSVLVSEFGWTLAGSTLSIAPVLEKNGADFKYGKVSEIELVFDGDTLWASAAGQRLVLTRLSPRQDVGLLVGQWQSITDRNETTVQDFRADGTLVVSVVQVGEAGRYGVYDKSINFRQQIPVPAQKRWKFKLSGSKLLVYMFPKLPPIELTKADRPTG